MKRVRNHVNPLKRVDSVAERIALPAMAEVEVELGCADAQFLFARAAVYPAVYCVGVEIREELVLDVNRRAEALGCANLRAVNANVNFDLDTLFPDGRLARVFVNFPDPWFKRRHHKRRVLTPEAVAMIHRKLAPGGELLFQSDIFELALEAMATIESTDLFDNRLGDWSFLPGPHPYGVRSLREERCEGKGERIWRMLYERSASQSSGSETS